MSVTLVAIQIKKSRLQVGFPPPVNTLAKIPSFGMTQFPAGW